MFKPEQIIGRYYKIISQLGEGGMGLVYKALDVNLGREVAIKFLLPEIAKDEDVVNRFLNEGRVMATINHPAVISVYASDVEEKSKVPFLVMEFVDGKGIDKCKDQLRNDVPELIRHYIQLLSGIFACHKKQIIHRDLKPENLIINKQGQLKILDFGIARSASRQTKTGMALGTPHYMSPEQCLGKQEITGKVDVYAAGIMLYEILTGILPFRVEGQVDDPALTIALMHLNHQADFDDFDKIPMGPEFKSLVERMMAKKAEDRPEVPEILNELNNILKLFNESEKPTVAQQAIQVSETSDKFGDIYKIEKELGTGGMGKVYKALDTALNRTVAVKVLHESTAKDNSLVERFIHEGQTLATVVHRNVMGIYASSKDKKTNRPFLVMEYIEGKPLSKLKKTFQKDCTKAVPIMLQLAEGLDACHEKGIIHRDLKPSNISITNSGLVKILDFGIAKTATNLTKTGMTVGTPEYMSPEQCTGSKNISTRSDIYSLGIIFWELIFGHVPFKADANTNPELSIALKHIEATLPAKAAIPDMSMVKIISLTRKMLDKDPESRPSTNQIIDELEIWLDEHQPDAVTNKKSSRRSLQKSSQAISDLVESSDQPKTSKLKFLGIGVLILIIGFTAFNYYNKSEKINYENAIKSKIKNREFASAAKLLNEYQNTEEGKVKASFLKVNLSKAMIEQAEQSAQKKDFQKAIELYSKAIVLDPANPKAAMNLSKIQQDFQTAEQHKERIKDLLGHSNLLLAGLAPGSGTRELASNISELEELGFASQAQKLKATWQTRFIASASPYISEQPEKALQYFKELQQHFSELEGLEELLTRARTRSDELKKELENADRLNSLTVALEGAIQNYTTEQQPDLILSQINRIKELGEEDLAEEFKQKLAIKMSADAEKLIINDPAKAIEFFNKAREIYPETAKIDSRIELAQESLKTLRSSAEMKQKRDELEKEIVIDIEKITPPQDTSDLVSKLARLEQFVDGSAKARKLRNRLFDKYFKAISKELETSPKNARRILAYCSELNPDAPGLKQLEENIEAEILREEQRKKAEQQKLRAERLDTARNAIYTGIKKDKIPEDLNKIYDEIKALSRDYPESEVPIKLFSHLEDRCREEIESSKENTKALETIEICLSLFQDNDKFQAYLHKKKHAISENQKIIQQKKLIAKEYKTIDNFINSPSKNKIESLNNSLDKIASEISDQEAQKARNKVIQALEKDFSTSSSVDSAQNTIALLEALDSSFKGRSDQKISQLKKSKTDSLHKQISNFEPSTDTSRLIELLNNFDDWNAQNEKIQALQTIKQNYQQKINEIGNQKPAKAIDLIDAVSSLSGLNSDDDLKNTRTRLLKLTKEKKADQEIQKMVTAGKNYANNSLILENTDRQFEIITYLQKHSPENAKIVLDMTVKRLIDNAQSKLDKKQFDEAENYIRVARQFSPESQEAQRLQVQIVQKRKAMNKPKEFVVGRTGNFKSISAAVAAAESGVTIKIQPGNYSEKLNLNKAVILEGTSFDNCSLNYSNGPTVTLSADATIHNLTVTNTSKVAQPTLLVKSGSPSISDCIITNNTPAPQPDFTACIAISGGNPVFSNNRILSSRGMGITITAGSPIIKNNQISNCQIYGIWLNGSSKAIISGNKISSNDKSGIGVKNFAAPSFTTNIVEENGENGFLIYSNAKGKYEGNRISKNKFAGIEIWDAQPEQIKNNVFNGNNRNAIYIRGSKALARLGKNQFNNTRGEEIKNSGGRIQNL